MVKAETGSGALLPLNFNIRSTLPSSSPTSNQLQKQNCVHHNMVYKLNR